MFLKRHSLTLRKVKLSGVHDDNERTDNDDVFEKVFVAIEDSSEMETLDLSANEVGYPTLVRSLKKLPKTVETLQLPGTRGDADDIQDYKELKEVLVNNMSLTHIAFGDMPLILVDGRIVPDQSGDPFDTWARLNISRRNEALALSAKCVSTYPALGKGLWPLAAARIIMHCPSNSSGLYTWLRQLVAPDVFEHAEYKRGTKRCPPVDPDLDGFMLWSGLS